MKSNIAARFFLFLILNFGALGIGGWFTGPGVSSDWYQNMNQAPWTPPGWVFGAAWTSIMICFTFYMTSLSGKLKSSNTWIILFAFQWILNVSWNPVFFYFHKIEIAFVLISTLTLVMGLFLFMFGKVQGWKSLLVLPYFIWLIIASSLNAFPIYGS